jgi:3-oxoacyl-(acyl-carrier-protein) synthase
MSGIAVHGLGAVSPAGWGVSALRELLRRSEPAPVTSFDGPRGAKLRRREIPAPASRPAFLAHPRLRRASAISHHTVAAALEALGEDAARVSSGELRLGVVCCTMAGSVNYSARFFGEVLADPATASPLVFPETVFNAPASHVSAVLAVGGPNYTLVGDAGCFAGGLSIAAMWLRQNCADGVVVIGAEESNWLVAEAETMFQRGTVSAAGAGAVYLKRGGTANALCILAAVTEPCNYHDAAGRREAIARTRAQLGHLRSGNELLLDSACGAARFDADESAAWADWRGARLSLKPLLGEALIAGAAWQCVAAADSVANSTFSAAVANIVGLNQQVVAARFERVSTFP